MKLTDHLLEEMSLQWDLGKTSHRDYLVQLEAKLKPLSLLEKSFIINCVLDHPLLAVYQELLSEQELR